MDQLYGSPVALSTLETTTAVLREILGRYHGQEKNFAKLVGKSVSWVKKVSAGIKPLTEDSARIIEAATGVSLVWLMAGDTSKPPVNALGKLYSLPDFEAHRADLKEGGLTTIRVVCPVGFLATIAAIGSAAGKNGKVSLFHWRLRTFLKKCGDEFGFDKEVESQVKPEVEASNLKDMAFYDAWKDQKSKISTTFRMSNEEEPESFFGMEISPKIHPPRKRRSAAK